MRDSSVGRVVAWLSLVLLGQPALAIAAELPAKPVDPDDYGRLEVQGRPLPLNPPYVLPEEFQDCLASILAFRRRNFGSTGYDIQFNSHSRVYLNYVLLRSDGKVRVGDWPPYRIDIDVAAGGCKIRSFRPSNGSEFETIPPHPEVTLE